MTVRKTYTRKTKSKSRSHVIRKSQAPIKTTNRIFYMSLSNYQFDIFHEYYPQVDDPDVFRSIGAYGYSINFPEHHAKGVAKALQDILDNEKLRPATRKHFKNSFISVQSWIETWRRMDNPKSW